MNKYLNIALIQSHITWENPVQNQKVLEEKIRAVDSKTDLIVLPEMFSTGFTMNAAEVAESMDGTTVKWLQKLAKEKKAAITGSIIIKEKSSYYNRLVFASPDQMLQQYDKHHLFTMARENEIFTAGSKEVIINYKGWKIKPQICYDLRFPVWSRNKTEYDMLLYVASWPKPRIHAWDTLLQARAIENMSYCIGVNRVGLDGMGYEYNGHSAVYDVLGHRITNSENLEKESIFYAELEKAHIEKTRQKLPFLKDADTFKLL